MYKQRNFTRQRYLDRLTRVQLRMPLLRQPLLTHADADRINGVNQKESASK